MRVIKFKGVPLHGKGWVSGLPQEYGDGRFISETALQNNNGKDWRVQATEVVPESICQFSGVLDKNKTQIYEADILKGNEEDYPDEPAYFGVCVFYRGKFGYAELGNGERFEKTQEEIRALIDSEEIYFNGFFDVSDNMNWEVVGNTNKS